ncbi:hypothetical protein G9A89_001877 [Geosiphon pyriformis]|nr:hypothetical protein G9A89_001877 [Geosiphon pyriformis]
MERTFIGDKEVSRDTEIPHPSPQEVEKLEAQRFANKNEKGKPKEGGSAGRLQTGAHKTTDEERKNNEIREF